MSPYYRSPGPRRLARGVHFYYLEAKLSTYFSYFTHNLIVDWSGD